MFELTDKVIVITGASSGIGRACAVSCSQQGAKIAVLGRNEGRLQETISLLAGKQHKSYSIDLKNYSAYQSLVETIVNDLGIISGFIHSAGIETVLPLKLTEPTHFENAFAVNVISAFEMTKHIIKKKHINQSGASMIYISSVMGVVGQPAKAVYSATKGALIAGTRSLALELARNKIRVNCVSPAMVRTGMSRALLDKVTPEALVEIQKAHPLGIGEADDIANACVFLLSDSSRWITGTNLLVDGGYTAQ
jgi:NAD(P)-dependent dehydrogenase (short-subunit alcohol dehydrogenase family)